MDQTQVLYLEPNTETAPTVIAALETALPNLSVQHVASAADAIDVLAAEPIDCVVSEWLPSDSDSSSFLDSLRAQAPTVPLVWFTETPADAVADSLDDERVDYVHNQRTDGTYSLLASRIRSAVSAEPAPTEAATVAPPEAGSDRIVDRSYAGILVFDTAGKITRLNPAAEQLLGLPAADAIGNNCEAVDMRTPDDQPIPLVDRPVARVLDSGEPVTDAVVGLPADTGRRWLSISALPLTNGHTVDGVVVTIEDISAEVELETTLETVLDRMTDGFIAFDTDLRLTYFSTQAINTDHYPREQYLGARLSELDPQLAVYEADLREALDTQEPATVETYIPEPTDGWFRARLYPSETGVSVFFREITEEKQRQQQLQQYETIVESVQDGVCILDSSMEFVFVNQAFTELVGYSEAELLGNSADLVTDNADMETARNRRAKLFAGDDEAAILSGELTTESSQRVPVETWMTPLTLTDGEQGTVGVARDLSYRKQTEATFTALYDAAHELLSVRSTEEIAEISVEAAASVLGFEDAIVLSYDEELNGFHPLAYTPSAEAHLPAPLPISASDASIAGRAFFEGEPIATEDMRDLPEAYNPETPYRRAMFIPLDDHGVLFVGDTETGTTSEQTLTVAELLGATVAAAFSRLASERRSAVHQETVAEQTAELEALTHTNALIRELVEPLVSATTREEVEAVVCSVVTAFDQYEFSWIGAAESRTDAIVVRASDGHEGGYLDWIEQHVADASLSTVDEPACRALSTRLPVSVEQISRDWQTATWRKEALSRGYQSVFSVPLTHNEISYGVLSVYADTTAAFDEYTQTVLTEFGRIIAYVIASTETKQGLLTDRRTDVELDIDDDTDVLHRLARRLDARLSFEGFVPQREDRSLLYFAAESPSEAVEAAAAEICAVQSLRVVTEQNGTTLFEMTVSGPILAGTVVDCGGIPTAITTDGDRLQVVVALPQTTDLRTFIERLGTDYPSTTVVSRQNRDHGLQSRETFRMQLLDKLTQRQEETLQAAYFARYFESPRGSTGTEVGESLGISQPTFNYHLRAALRTLLTMLFEESESPPLDR